MRTTAAHLLRRIARKCIAWSNKIDPPVLVRNEHSVSSIIAAEERLARAHRQYAQAQRDWPRMTL